MWSAKIHELRLHQMNKTITLAGLVLLLSGCSSVKNALSFYDIEKQQGNVVTQEMINQLKPGMTEEQVRFILGNPLIVDTFTPNRWDYVYNNKNVDEDEFQQQHVSLFFNQNRLTQIVGDLRPQ